MNSASRYRVLAVGFSSEELERVSGLCTNAEFLHAGSVSQVQEMLQRFSNPEIDLLLVSTADQGEQEAVLECLKLRDHSALVDVPLLAAIANSQEDVGREVKRIKQSDCIVHPIEERQLSSKMRRLGLQPRVRTRSF